MLFGKIKTLGLPLSQSRRHLITREVSKAPGGIIENHINLLLMLHYFGRYKNE